MSEGSAVCTLNFLKKFISADIIILRTANETFWKIYVRNNVLRRDNIFWDFLLKSTFEPCNSLLRIFIYPVFINYLNDNV